MKQNKGWWVSWAIILSIGFFFLGILCEGLGKNTKYLEKEVETTSATDLTIKPADSLEQCEKYFLDWVVDGWQPKLVLTARDIWWQAKQLDERFGGGFRMRRLVAEVLMQTKEARQIE